MKDVQAAAGATPFPHDAVGATLAQFINSIPHLAWVSRPDGQPLWLNARWHEYTGLALVDLQQPKGWAPVLDPADHEAVHRGFYAAITSGQTWEHTFRIRRHDGVYRWFLTRALPLRDASGAVTGWVGTSTDIDEPHRAAMRTRFMAQLSEALSSLDIQETLKTVAQTVVPEMGDWCVIDLLRDDGWLERATVAHIDPAKVELGWALWRRFPTPPDRPYGAPAVVRSRKPELVPLILDAHLDRVEDTEQRAMLRGIGISSSMCVALVSRERVLGAITFVSAQPSRRFDATDLAFAEDLAARAAVAIDNAQLYAEQKSTEAALRDSERQFRTLVDSMPSLAWSADPSGKVEFTNRRWNEYTGVTLDALKRGERARVHDPSMAAPIAERWAQSVASGEPFEMEHPLRRHDGSFRWFLTRAIPVRDAEGHIVRWFGTNTDIDDQRRAVETMREAEEKVRHANLELEQRVIERTAALEEANRELESFTYSVSHDLRAPLRHISGFAELLERRAAATLDDRARGYLRTIHGAAQRGGQLVDDLLSFSRMGRTELLRREVNLGALLDDVKTELAPDTEGRAVEWVMGPMPTVMADPSLLRAALRNLLGNALKYTRTRPLAVIDVRATLTDRDVEVCVRDNGVGFEMQYVDKLFGVFQRLHSVEQFEGTGIGLANVRRIIARHGGRTWAEGAPDQGAAFHFTLPLPSPRPEEPA